MEDLLPAVSTAVLLGPFLILAGLLVLAFRAIRAATLRALRAAWNLLLRRPRKNPLTSRLA